MTKKIWLSVLVVALLTVSSCTEKKEEDKTNQDSQEKVEQTKSNGKNEQKGGNTKMVKLKTTYGDIVIELNEEKAPVTVKNFLQYVEDGFYDGLIFHRVINGFMVQGGGLTEDMQSKKTRSPIVNEADNGLKNDKGTVAMARTGNPDSATAQFFINHADNDFLNYGGPNEAGYAVFGKTVEGLDVVEKIANVKTTTKSGMGDVPVDPVFIISAEVVSEE